MFYDPIPMCESAMNGAPTLNILIVPRRDPIYRVVTRCIVSWRDE